MSDKWRWAALGFVVAVSAFFHGVVIVNRPIGIDPDAPSYIRPAVEIVRHHRFYGSNPLTYAFQQPGNERLPGPSAGVEDGGNGEVAGVLDRGGGEAECRLHGNPGLRRGDVASGNPQDMQLAG